MRTEDEFNDLHMRRLRWWRSSGARWFEVVSFAHWFMRFSREIQRDGLEGPMNVFGPWMMNRWVGLDHSAQISVK